MLYLQVLLSMTSKGVGSPALSADRRGKTTELPRQREQMVWESVCMDSAIDQPKQATGLISQDRPETE